ncbi:MAG: phosphohistidine phosphatase SixA [Bdellovibrionaceae bacterium]|nr:phosphohistidine phosphatase SixA [Pseudobdellovibrionaceae bacterium]MBX3034478.1 phosphohistidine phosphatase SixA [Pseudobdellovibrionaceae bacterium]
MELYLIRHAVAEDREEFARRSQDDSLRPLTVKGRKKMQKVAIRLRDQVGDVDLIVTSPYLRARQTAEILSQMFFETKIIEAPELVPHGPPQAFVRWMKAHARDLQSVAVVGHEPQLSLLASYLLAGAEESLIAMKKSGIACLETVDVEELGPSTAELSWLVPPKIWTD